VYGAAASSGGDAVGAGSETGIEYGGASADADDSVNIETTAATAMTKETFARRFLGEWWVALIAATPLTRETGLFEGMEPSKRRGIRQALGLT
jgi:hypothetical protein